MIKKENGATKRYIYFDEIRYASLAAEVQNSLSLKQIFFSAVLDI